MLNIPEAPAKVLGKINYTVDNGKEPSYYFYVPQEEVEMERLELMYTIWKFKMLCSCSR